MSTAPLLSQLESFLSLTNKREQIISRNMANVDTPGFRTQDMDFGRELSRAMAAPGEGELHVATHTVRGLPERPDGNDVDLDRESLLLAESQLQYQMGTQLMKAQFHQLLTAINGDK